MVPRPKRKLDRTYLCALRLSARACDCAVQRCERCFYASDCLRMNVMHARWSGSRQRPLAAATHPAAPPSSSPVASSSSAATRQLATTSGSSRRTSFLPSQILRQCLPAILLPQLRPRPQLLPQALLQLRVLHRPQLSHLGQPPQAARPQRQPPPLAAARRPIPGATPSPSIIPTAPSTKSGPSLGTPAASPPAPARGPPSAFSSTIQATERTTSARTSTARPPSPSRRRACRTPSTRGTGRCRPTTSASRASRRAPGTSRRCGEMADGSSVVVHLACANLCLTLYVGRAVRRRQYESAFMF